jgi:uncharacterized membrane protein
MLVAFPLGLFITSVIFDVIHYASGNSLFAEVAFWNLTLGGIGALLAAIPGLLDWLTVPSGTRAKQVGAIHAIVNVGALCFFVLSWAVRLAQGIRTGGAGPFVLSLIGLCALVVGGWLGGEMVERLGIGVYDDAHADAPSSLELAPGERGRVPPTPRPA